MAGLVQVYRDRLLRRRQLLGMSDFLRLSRGCRFQLRSQLLKGFNGLPQRVVLGLDEPAELIRLDLDGVSQLLGRLEDEARAVVLSPPDREPADRKPRDRRAVLRPSFPASARGPAERLFQPPRLPHRRRRRPGQLNAPRGWPRSLTASSDSVMSAMANPL